METSTHQPKYGLLLTHERSNMNDPSTSVTATSTAPRAEIWIAEVRVQNFRSIIDLHVPLEQHVTFLVGENNAGKSSFMLALAAACGSYSATRDDLHNAGPAPTTRATIDLMIRPFNSEFSEVATQRLDGNVGSGPGLGEWSAIRTTLQTTNESPVLTPKRTFMRWSIEARKWEEQNQGPQRHALELLSAHFVQATRDISTDIGRRMSDWNRVLTDLEITSSNRSELEKTLENLNDKLLDSSLTLSRLSQELQKIKDTQSGIGDISLRPLPADLAELARSVDIFVGTGSGAAALPIRLQGLGSRSLAALRVLHTYLDLRVGIDQGVRPQIITLLEEPEAHLHPQAQVAMRDYILGLPDQVIVATHSNALIADAELKAIRLFRNSRQGTQVRTLNDKTVSKVAVFRRYISRPLGELFFAKVVVLVDGTAERITLPVFLEAELGRGVAGLGVTILDMEGPSQEWVQKVVTALAELELPWFAFVDNDSAGKRSMFKCVDSAGVHFSEAHPQIVMSGDKQLEQMFLDAEYMSEIQIVADKYYDTILELYTPKHRRAYMDFLKKNKGSVGELIARKAIQNGRASPAPIIELAQLIRELLKLDEPHGNSVKAEGDA